MPQNTSLARNSNFLFAVSGERGFTLAVQNSNIANVDLGTTEFPNRYKDITIPSNKTVHDELNVQFLVSEDLSEWINIYKWILTLKNNDDSHLEDVKPCQLTVLSGQKKPLVEFSYRDCWPYSLDGMQYTVIEDSMVITSNATFKFSDFIITTSDGERIDEFYGQR